MAGNNFKLFDENRQNMLSDQEYNDSQQRLSGVQAGIASSMLNNKFSYQMSLVAYAIAQMMNANGYDATDSLAVSAFVGNLSNSVLQKVIDKATDAEAIAGLNDTKWITPAKVKQFAENYDFAAEHTLISANVAGILGLNPAANPTVNDGMAKLATGLPLKLIAEYKQAGTYTWTVPEGITKVTVAMISGGGSGAAGFDGHQYGGASGRATILEHYSVTPGTIIPIVVGAGGAAVEVTTGNSSNGRGGGGTSFDGFYLMPGGGGGAHGANGGQFAASSGYFRSYFSEYRYAALYGGRELFTDDGSGYVFSKSPGIFDRMLSLGILPFCLCAGNPAYAPGNVEFQCGPMTLPNGNTSGYSKYAVSSGYTSAIAAKGTDPGCGGGAATVGSSSGHAVSAAGCDGGVFIYVKEGQQ